MIYISVDVNMENKIEQFNVCQKINQNWGIRKIKRCYCINCKKEKKVKKIKINQINIINELFCYFCQKEEKYMLDRCRKCYENYSKSIMNEKIKEEDYFMKRSNEREDVKIYLKNIQCDTSKTSEELLKFEKINTKYKKYIEKGIQNFQEIIDIKEENIVFYYFEKSLAKFLQKICSTNANNNYYLQLHICNKYSDSLIKILKKCQTNDSCYFMLRNILFLIKNNSVAMMEYNQNCGLLEYIKKYIIEQNLSGEIISICKNIIKEFSNYGFE